MDSSSNIDVDSDPRVTGEYIRQVPIDHGTLTLVGVVHDHPASTYRVQHVIEGVDPDVLALELPPISLPLFEQYAATDQTPPTFGGEMSAAIQAADPGIVVGIDRPTGGFFRRLVQTVLRERPTLETGRDIVSNVVETTKHALLCRIAAAIGARTSVRLEVDSPISHGIARTDSPDDQASDELEQIRRSWSFTNAFRTASRSRANQLEDDAREAAMAARLVDLCGDGDIIAVVGIDHLDPLTERLNDTDEWA